MRSLNQESDKRVVQIPQLDSRQASDRRIGIRLSNGCIRILRMSPSSEVSAEHVQESVIGKGGEGS